MKTNLTTDVLNEQITRLSPAKRALLELRLKNGDETISISDTIPPRVNQDSAALSFAQQRLWFLDQLEPGKPSYNVPVAKRISGPLNLGALQQTLNAIVERHEVLRTRVLTLDGEPLQIIAEAASVALPLTDISHLPAPEREVAVRRLCKIEIVRCFNLAEGPLFRAALLRLSDQDHILLITMHHIVSDGWSLGLLSNELNTLYDAFSADQPSPLSDLPIQYSDYAEWQRKWLQGPELDKQLSYWRRQLSGIIEPLELPGGRNRPTLSSYCGASETIMLSKSMIDQLSSMGQQHGATLFMTLLAAFQTLLYRYSGQTDVAVGTPIANRNRVETEKLIGFFANTLVLRTKLDGNPTFLELLGRVREVALGAYAHQDLPFEKLVEELQPNRSLNRNPLFDVLFSMQNAPTSVLDSSTINIKPFGLENSITRFDLEIYLADRSHGVACTFVYSTDLFDRETIERMMGHFQRLLESITVDPRQQISELRMLPESELRQMRVWNETRSEWIANRCVHHLFENQAALDPERIAVCFGQLSISYAELNRRANQLAHYFRSVGIGPDCLVAGCLDRGIDMLVGLLATLKAGAAYVPLDPSYPKARLELMQKNSGARILVTSRDLLSKLPEPPERVFCMDRDLSGIAGQSPDNPVVQVDIDNLSYVIYTSGSTGQPKGVAMTHRALANLVKWQIERPAFATPARTLQFSPLSFDVSFQEIFSTLLSGGTLVLTSEQLRRDPLGLLQLLKEERVERLFIPYTGLRFLAEASNRGGAIPEHCRNIVTAGEQLEITPQLSGFFENLRGCTLENQYGPSESHVVTAFTLSEDVKDWPALPAIGNPIANTKIYLVDPDFNPTPLGVPGELYIGGAGLARGYLNCPELTADRFVPDNFSGEPGARLYKTGDRARYLSDGTIEFLGRLDDQVKVRGFRVELGEVEAALGRHPAVRESVVALREDVSGEKRLVAYVVLGGGQTATVVDLRDDLKETLPDYMIPSTFITLSELPVTPSGKIDRKALPAPDCSRPELEKGFVAPRSQEEEGIATIWQQVLRLDQVGIHDNFFDLGGHSMLAVRLMSEIEKVYGKKLPLSCLYKGATVEYLARLLRPQTEPYAHLTLLEIKPGEAKPAFFCVSAPNVNSLGYVSLARYLDKDQPVYALQSAFRKRSEDEYTFEEVEALATEYLKAMREVQPQGPYMFGGMCAGALIAFDMARQLEEQGQQVSLLALLDTWDIYTETPLWYLYDYSQRLKYLFRLIRKGEMESALNKAKGVMRRISSKFFPRAMREEAHSSAKPWRLGFKPESTFVPRVYSGRAIVFRIHKRPYYRIRDHQLGWGRRVLGGVDVQFIPGEHSTIFRQPHVEVLAQKLSNCIQEVVAENSF